MTTTDVTSELDTAALGEDVEETFQSLVSSGWTEVTKTVLIALGVLVACLVAKRIIIGVLRKALKQSKLDQSFHAFIRSGVNILLWFVTLMVVAECLGINATSLLALVSIAGLAVSLSIKDTLSNLAGGLTILVTHPFKVGDYVKIDDTEGYVQEIGMVYTRLRTYDRRLIVLPNSNVTDGEIVNYFTEPLRRVERRVRLPYDAPVEQVKSLLLEQVAKHPMALSDPPPSVRMTDLLENAVEYRVWVWCKSEHYWTVHDDTLDLIKQALDREGITIPHARFEVEVREGAAPTQE